MIENLQANLTQEERRALTLWRWCYILKVEGFTLAEARRLCWCRWLYSQGRLLS